jgi:hypothetical protein
LQGVKKNGYGDIDFSGIFSNLQCLSGSNDGFNFSGRSIKAAYKSRAAVLGVLPCFSLPPSSRPASNPASRPAVLMLCDLLLGVSSCGRLAVMRQAGRLAVNAAGWQAGRRQAGS